MTTPAEIADFSPYGRGICASCGRPFDLTKKGLVRHHLKPRQPGTWTGYGLPRCPGAGQKPAAPSPA